MKVRANRRDRPELIRPIIHSWILAVALALTLCALRAPAQDLPVQDEPPLPQQPVTPPTTMEEADVLQKSLYPTETEAAPEVQATPEGEAGRSWKLTLHGAVSATYDDNIFISPTHRQADLIFNLSPGLKFAWGDWLAQQENFLVADYTITGLLFVDHPSQDAVEQQATLDGQWRLARLTLILHFSFQDLTDPDIDVGSRTRRELYQIAELNKFDISDQTYIEANLYNNIFDYLNQLSSAEWIGRLWFNYKQTPKLTIGAGVSGGYLAVQDSPGQTFEQVLGRVIYTPTDKLSFEADGGIELRQLQSADRVTPVFTVAATYKPFEATQVKVSAYRKVQNSALLANENYTATGLTVEAQRGLRAGCVLVLAAGYSRNDYSTSSNAGGPTRHDNYLFARPSIRFEVATRLHIEVFYEYQEDDSTFHPTSFHDMQTGVQVRYDY